MIKGESSETTRPSPLLTRTSVRFGSESSLFRAHASRRWSHTSRRTGKDNNLCASGWGWARALDAYAVAPLLRAEDLAVYLLPLGRVRVRRYLVECMPSPVLLEKVVEFVAGHAKHPLSFLPPVSSS